LVVERMEYLDFDHIERWSWRLREILEHCIRLRPDLPELQYRLGALLCIMNDEEAAFSALTQGQDLDLHALKTKSSGSDREWISVMARVYFPQIDRNGSTSKIRKATIVAYIARALVLGVPTTRNRLLDLMDTDMTLKLWKIVREKQPDLQDTADRILKRLLCAPRTEEVLR
jgi:hypothetical protein